VSDLESKPWVVTRHQQSWMLYDKVFIFSSHKQAEAFCVQNNDKGKGYYIFSPAEVMYAAEVVNGAS
jgi:hypothetical protein